MNFVDHKGVNFMRRLRLWVGPRGQHFGLTRRAMDWRCDACGTRCRTVPPLLGGASVMFCDECGQVTLATLADSRTTNTGSVS